MLNQLKSHFNKKFNFTLVLMLGYFKEVLNFLYVRVIYVEYKIIKFY